MFRDAVHDGIPSKTVKNINSPPWINGEILHAIRKKETVRRKLKSSPTDALSKKFRELRTRVKRLVSEGRSQFFDTISEALHTNPKRFWSVFKQRKKHASVPGKIVIGSSGTTDPTRSACCPRDITELFNDYFSSIVSGSDERNSFDGPSTEPDDSQTVLTLTPEDVLAALLRLGTNKATGPEKTKQNF